MKIAAGLLLAASLCAQPSIFVVGDSTASNKDRRGWGDPFADYFDRGKAKVVNCARAGRSARTFLTEGLWEKVAADLKPGDYVLIQFGHNDGGPPDRDRARGDLPGTGEEEREFTLPDGRKEVVHTFGWYLRKFVREAREKGAVPILLSPTVRNIWNEGHVERGNGRFGQWSREVAEQERVAFADISALIADRYETLGEARVKALFPEDHTHTSPAGADLNASIVARAAPEFLRWLSALGTLPEPRDAALPTVWLIGDSTVRNGRGDGSNGQWGWGEPLVDRFDTSKVNIVNRAMGGLSSRTYLTQGHWERVMTRMKSGDFVIMQFGHNDAAALNDNSRARGTIKGTGEESEEIDNLLTGKHEVVHTYGWYLRKFISDTRSGGATPIVCSPIPRKIWKDGRIQRGNGSYADWAKDVARTAGATFIDLTERIAARYEALGPEKVEAMFGDEHTHTSRSGAELNADIVAEGLKGTSLEKWLRRKP